MTRAVQFEILLAGIRHPTTGAPLSGGYVQFKAAGTDTAKAVWTDEAKTTATYQVDLDAAGRAKVFGDGIYKLKIYDASDVPIYTDSKWDNIKVQFYSTKVRSVIASGALSVDDDFILVDTTAGNITLSLPAASLWSHPIVVKKTSSDANTITLDPSGTELIDGGATLAFSFPGYAFTVVSDGTNLYGATPNPSYLPLSGGRMTGAIEFGDANKSIRNIGEHIQVESAQTSGAAVAVLTAQDSYLASNARLTAGGDWERRNIAAGAYILGATTAGPVIFTAAAGANPISWAGPYGIKYGDYPFFHGRVKYDGTTGSEAGTTGRLPSGWSVAKTGTGQYTVTHNLGHSNYTVLPVPYGFSSIYAVSAHINTINATTFLVETNINDALADASFGFSLFLD